MNSSIKAALHMLSPLKKIMDPSMRNSRAARITLFQVIVVLDSGAIMASERNDPTIAAVLNAARKNRTTILVPSTVVAETWRGPSTHPRTGQLFGSVDAFPELNQQTAKAVGALLAKSKTAAVVDGSVVAIAIAGLPAAIVTSDVHDITHLLKSAGVRYALASSHRAASVPVIVIRV